MTAQSQEEEGLAVVRAALEEEGLAFLALRVQVGPLTLVLDPKSNTAAAFVRVLLGFQEDGEAQDRAPELPAGWRGRKERLVALLEKLAGGGAVQNPRPLRTMARRLRERLVRPPRRRGVPGLSPDGRRGLPLAEVA